jgi:hypothetical protein
MLIISEPVYKLQVAVTGVWIYTFIFTQSTVAYKLDHKLVLETLSSIIINNNTVEFVNVFSLFLHVWY